MNSSNIAATIRWLPSLYTSILSLFQVEIEVDTCDKGGNFIGWLFYEGKNLSISLLEVCPTVYYW